MGRLFTVLSGIVVVSAVSVTAARAGHVSVDFTKDPIVVKSGSALCEDESELEAYEHGASARCSKNTGPIEIKVLDTKLTGFLGGGAMNIKARAKALGPIDFYVNAEDLTNEEIR